MNIFVQNQSAFAVNGGTSRRMPLEVCLRMTAFLLPF